MKRYRATLFLVAIPLYMAGLFVAAILLLSVVFEPDRLLASPLTAPWEMLIDGLGDSDVWVTVGTAIVIITILQALFLLPLTAARIQPGARPKSLVVSVVVGGLIATLLVTGVLTAVVSLIGLIATGEAVEFGDDDWGALYLVPSLALIVGWPFWTVVMLGYSRDRWADRALGRLARMLFAGTLIELIAVIPLDVLIRRKSNCYCNTGTFVTLAVACTAAMFLAGPGMLIPLLGRRHRRWRRGECPKCGYPRAPGGGRRCSECGESWEKPSAQPSAKTTARTTPALAEVVREDSEKGG